jgi:hypothetical protein
MPFKASRCEADHSSPELDAKALDQSVHGEDAVTATV